MYFDSSELLAATSGLGSYGTLNGEKYFFKHDHCIECIQDIQRMLRRDNPETRDVLKQLGAWNTVKNELIPLITTYRYDKSLISPACKLLVTLTMPPKSNSFDIAQQISYLQQYKEAFLSKEVLTVVVGFLTEPLSHMEGDRKEEDSSFIELILTLFRNLLLIPDPPPVRTVADIKTNMHEMLILLYQREHILELLIILAQNVEDKLNRKWNVLLLEIFYLLLRRETPENLWNALNHPQDQTPPNNMRRGGISGLTQLLQKEKEETKRKARDGLIHPRFSGVLMKTTATGNHQVITKPISSAGLAQTTFPSQKLAVEKVRTGRGLAKVPLADEHYPESSPDLRKVLKEFSEQFLDLCYTDFHQTLVNEFFIRSQGYSQFLKKALMRSLKSDIEREDARIIPSDVSNFLWLVQFFTGFHFTALKQIEAKVFNFEPEKVSGDSESGMSGTYIDVIGVTMDLSSFNFVIKKSDEYLFAKNWTSMGVSIGALTNMMKVLHTMSISKVQDIRTYAVSLQTNIFYDKSTYLDKILEYIKSFDASKQPKSAGIDLKQPNSGSHKIEEIPYLFVGGYVHRLLVDLVQLLHVTLDMLDTQANIYVKVKRAKKVPKKDMSTVSAPGVGVSISTDEPLPSHQVPAPEEDNVFRETKLNFSSYLNSCAHNGIISHYCYVLADYTTNNPDVNNNIISLFRRIVDHCDMAPIFYQASLFSLFQQILEDPTIRRSPNTEQIFLFADDIITRFFKMAEANRFLFAAGLFWKTRTDCLLINGAIDDSDNEQLQATKTTMEEWTTAEDEIAISTFNMYKGSDTALDIVAANMQSERTPAEIYKRLEVLKVINKSHKWVFPEIANAAKLIKDPTEKEKPKSARDVAKKMCLSKKGRGPKALEWLINKLDEAEMLRERFTDFNIPDINAQRDPLNKVLPHEILTTGEEEVAWYKSASKLMRMLGFAPPEKGKTFWTIPASEAFTAAKLKGIINVLKDAQSDAQLEKEQFEKGKEKRKRKNKDNSSDNEASDRSMSPSKSPSGDMSPAHNQINEVGVSSESDESNYRKKGEEYHEIVDDSEANGAGRHRKSRRLHAKNTAKSVKSHKQKTEDRRDLASEGISKIISETKDSNSVKRRRLKKRTLAIQETQNVTEDVETAPALPEANELSVEIKSGDELDDIFETQEALVQGVPMSIDEGSSSGYSNDEK